MEQARFEDLKGKTLTRIDVDKTGYDHQIDFFTEDGLHYVMRHYQDCCESVTIEDICGELAHLLNEPILLAEEVTKDEPDSEWGDIAMWTFYKLSTNRGSVTIRWHGSSNGYYSVGVSFYEGNSREEE